MSKALKFQIEESYKQARTNLAYSIIKKGCKKIVFTSSSKSEGKTTTAVNVSIALSQQVDTKVIIVDCDLRRPASHVALGLSPKLGLANYLNNECDLEETITKTDTPNLDFIGFGAIPPNPSELLSSSGMEELVSALEERYDYIIFDTPPVNMVVDVIPLVRLSDGVVIVIKHKQTTQPELNKAVGTLKRNDAKILGIIINQIPSVDTSKGNYFGKKNDNYYGQ
jgi:capsular exopolysaccharide synthesis family protein